MQLFLEIGQIFISTLMIALVMPIFWIVLFLVYLQYRRQAATEKKLYGRTLNKVGKQIFYSLGLGVVGGLIASVILIFLGLSLEQIGLYFIWPVAILLLLVNPRYLCFSYAGGIVAVMVLFARHIIVPLLPVLADNIVIETLLRVHIPALLVLIGLLHLIEALLIYAGGHWGSSPIYLKQESGEVIGAFSLQRFWPLPLVALLVSMVAEPEIVGVSMPEWWPIIQSNLEPGEGKTLQYMLIPVAAGLGYGDIAVSSTPRERTAFSAKWLAVYSIILLFFAVGAEYFAVFILPGVLFAPIGHEVLILYGKNEENKKPPRYRSRDEGIILMEVLPGTPAHNAGLQQDDIIKAVNGEIPQNNRDFLEKIEESYFMVLLEGSRNGEVFSKVFKKETSEKEHFGASLQAGLRARGSLHSILRRYVELGMIPVPSPDSPVYLQMRKPDPLARLKGLVKRK
ncbi:MAG: PDZ domain-containing protein [Bacillota bacterium]